jgi:hypothetical protein
MMQKFLVKYSTNINLIILFSLMIILNLCFGKMLQGIDTNITDINWHEKKIPDLHFYYSADQIKEIIHNIGPQGRITYLKVILTLDYLYPIVYTLFFSLLLFKLDKNTKVAIIPFSILIFDYLENTSIIILLASYPKELNYISTLAGFFTALKWISVIITLICLVMIIAKIVLGKRTTCR